MVSCPNCKRQVTKPVKKWKYGRFIAEAYVCGVCGTHFNEYTIDGKHSFTLKQGEGGHYKKA